MTDGEIALARLEERMKNHREEMKLLTINQNELFKITRNINRSMMRIQYIAYGMAGLFVLEQFGIKELIKAMFA
ncbi:MAG TPA: hypothetical protein ENI67_04685 [Gammaproteobacteria bacterium]|mgnify:CR=1 FL=1|nr:hypothetical protein [Gammaproteobacteria bacterium]